MRMQNDDKKEIKKALKSVYERFSEMIAENEELRAENARLRSIRYKDEELARMKKEVETGNKMLANGFSVSDKEKKMTKRGHNCSFHYEFYNSQIGTFGKVVCDIHHDSFQFQSP